MDLSASLLIALVGVLYPIITRKMLGTWIPNRELKLIIIGGCSLLGVYIIRMGLRFFVQYYGHVMGVKMQSEMRSDMFEKLQKLPYSYFDKHETGDVMSRLTNDLFDISELAHHGPENIIVASITVLGTFIYLLTINWILALILALSVPLCFFVTINIRKKSRIAFSKSKKAIADVNVRVESSISGIRVTKAFTNEKKEKEKFEVSNKEYCAARSSVYKSMGAFFATSQFIVDLFNVLVLIFGGILMYNGKITLADYSAFIVSVGMFTTPITTLINFTEQFQSGSTGFKRFLEVMDEEEEKDNEGAIEYTGLKNEISFEDVSFKYENTEEDVLDHVSFKIRKGESIALVGPSGGGKTTICHLIPRFYFLDDGEILFDGTPSTNLTLRSLRSHIGIVQQDVFLFGGTILENIKYGKQDATMDEIKEASRRANILDYVESLDKGWDTEIGERGIRLSGGQKQRLSIARAFLKDPEILILDEATSALDNTTEMMIQSSLEELSKGRTTITVAHRLSTIKNADRIIVISDGKIKEMGTHDELIEKNGMYAELYRLQFRDTKNE